MTNSLHVQSGNGTIQQAGQRLIVGKSDDKHRVASIAAEFAAMAALCAATAFAVTSSSASFVLQTDALTNGGGPSSSARYILQDSAIGQSIPPGSSSSSSYRNLGGVILPVEGPLMVEDWVNY